MMYEPIRLRVSTALVLLVLLVALSACGAFVPPFATPARPQPGGTAISAPVTPVVVDGQQASIGWEYRWLQGIPCQPPCWEGVTPGLSTVTETVTLLRRSPIVARVERYQGLGFEGLVYWWWTSGAEGGSAMAFGNRLTGHIQDIMPRYPSSFRLADIIRAFGEPSDVDTRSFCGPDAGSGAFYQLGFIYRKLVLQPHLR